MIVVFDASVLIFLFEKDAKAPIDPKTEKQLDRCYDRVNFLVAELQKKSAKLVIPTPALAEILVHAADAAPEWLNTISASKHFVIAPFDALAAIEYSALQAERVKPHHEGKRKAKFDDQILAIAKICNADIIYSSDKGIANSASPRFSVIGIFDLPLPPEEPQGELFV